MFPYSSVRWRDVVETVPEAEDYLLHTKRECPKWRAAHQNEVNSPEMRQVVRNNADFFQMLSQLAGKNISKIGHVNMLYQTLTIEKSRGFDE